MGSCECPKEIGRVIRLATTVWSNSGSGYLEDGLLVIDHHPQANRPTRAQRRTLWSRWQVLPPCDWSAAIHSTALVPTG